VRLAWRDNPGLTFVHRRDGDRDIYFVTNVQEHAVDMPIEFRVSGKTPWEWNPYDGSIRRLLVYTGDRYVTTVPVRLAPYESTFIIFEADGQFDHVIYTDAWEVRDVGEDHLELVVNQNGTYTWQLNDWTTQRVTMDDVPATFRVSGMWGIEVKYLGMPFGIDNLSGGLTSWTTFSMARSFSGTGVYTLDFELPAGYVREDIELRLDLGDVGDVAEVHLNGAPAGVAWMRGQDMDVTKLVREGTNSLEVRVTNTLINRVSYMTEPPPVPDELQERLGNGLNDTPEAMARLTWFSPLPRSGLLGPVVIRPLKRVIVPR
jgi:hypothetical protein